MDWMGHHNYMWFMHRHEAQTHENLLPVRKDFMQNFGPKTAFAERHGMREVS